MKVLTVMLWKCIVVFCILGPFATMMTSNQTIVWKLKTPVYLTETASILCIIQENGKPGHMAWKKGGNLIGINNAAFNLTKYDVFINYRRSSMMYSLHIKNIVMEDFNLVYRCESGFTFAAGILPFNEDTLVALPKKGDTSCIFSLKEGILEVSVGVTYVYPKPKCIVIFKNKDITRYLKTNYTKESTLYSVTFYLFYITEDCGNISIACVIGKDERSILKKSHEFKDCKHSNPAPPTDHRNLSEIEVASIIAVLLIMILSCVIFGAYVRRRLFPSMSRHDFRMSGSDVTLPFISEAYFLEDPVNIECREGENAILTCKIKAGSPSVKWTKDGYDIAVNQRCEVFLHDITHQLTIKNSQLTDSGEYCVQVGGSFRKVQLQIKAYFLEDPVNSECREGEDAILTCKIIAGSPSVKWLKDGDDIAVNHRCVVSWHDITHQLTIKKSQLTDSGEYCVQVGWSFRKVQLQIKEN